MARSRYSNSLKNRTNRLKLPIRKKPYKLLIAPQIFLCYRRNEGPGTWSVEAGWLKRFALADDFESANNVSVMDFWQAQKHALKMVRGNEGESDKPVTVAEAIDAYAVDLAARQRAKGNATSFRRHVPDSLLTKTVMLLTETELSDWLKGLVAKGLDLASANRYAKSFKAALALAARRDKRITNRLAWQNGLRPLKTKGGNAPPRDNYYQPDASILAIVRECTNEDAEFGALIDCLAGTGMRESQALKLWPADICDDWDSAEPHLMVWCSNKGNENRSPEQRKIDITPALARKLKARALSRGPNRPLFDRIWNMSARFRVVLKRLKLDLTLTPYTLRHSSIIRQIRAKRALRFVCFHHDTSEVEVRRTYGRYLNEALDGMRGGLLDDAEPTTAMDNVIPMAR